MTPHGLTEAQRQALLTMPADGRPMVYFACDDEDLIRHRAAMRGLCDLGICTLEVRGYQITPAGIALRAKLDAEGGR